MAEPSEQQLLGALRKADAAGDVSAAKAIAKRIQSIRTTPAADFSGVSATTDTTETGSSLGRDIGMGARSAMRGVAGIADLAAAPVMAGLELAGAGPQMRYTEGADWIADKLGLGRPSTPRERVMSNIGEGLSGAAVTLGTGAALQGPRIATQVVPTARQAVGQALASNPATQLASAATGTGAAGVTREMGGGQGAQLVAGLVGGLGPSLAQAGTAATVRGALRGGETGRETVAKNIDAFRTAGTTPSVGQATQGIPRRSVLGGVEQTLSRTPGAAGYMLSRARNQGEEIGKGVEQVAQRLSPGSSAGKAGVAVQRGVNDFVTNSKATAGRLYDDIDQYIAPDAPVGLSNTQQILGKLTTPMKGAESTTALLINPKIAQFDKTLGEDLMASGSAKAIPYQAVKDLRTRVGSMLQGNELISDIPKAELKQLYRALSNDLEAAATTPEAKRAVTRANNYYKALQNRTDILESAIDKNGGPEKVFSALWSGARDGNTTLKAVMQSLPKDGQKELSAAFVRRLGRAVDSAQNETGDAFSAQTFLSNWNKVSPEARKTLFDRHGPGFSNDMDKIAKVAANLREGSQTFANPSGTAAATAQIAGLTGFVTSLFTNPTVAAAIGGGALTANTMARAMTNPRFVSWLANSTKLPTSAIPAQATVLRQIAERQNEPELAEAADLIEQGYQAQQQAP
jgi:hypothetical protein